MFGVAIHIALKMAIKIIRSCKRPLPTFTNLNFRLIQQKIRKKDKKMQQFGLKKTSENDLLTLNYGLPSSFTTVST